MDASSPDLTLMDAVDKKKEEQSFQADTFEEMKGLPKMIKQEGYLTGFYGKWHMELAEMTARFALQVCHEYLLANMTEDEKEAMYRLQKAQEAMKKMAFAAQDLQGLGRNASDSKTRKTTSSDMIRMSLI